MFLDYDRLPGIVPNLTVTNTGLFCKNGFPIESFLCPLQIPLHKRLPLSLQIPLHMRLPLSLQIPRRSESLLLYYNIPQKTSDSY